MNQSFDLVVTASECGLYNG